MRIEDAVEGRVYAVELKRAGGKIARYEGRLVKKNTFTHDHDEAILLGVVGEGHSIRIAKCLITDVTEVIEVSHAAQGNSETESGAAPPVPDSTISAPWDTALLSDEDYLAATAPPGYQDVVS